MSTPRTSPLTLHAAPDAGFDQPFEMLSACHDRVERMLLLLERLAQHLADKGRDEPARQAARDVMRYFDLAGPAHHEDEERHLFPALLARGDAEVRAVVRTLQADHAAMTPQWQAVRADLAELAADATAATGPAALDPAAAVRWRDFAALYRRHIEAEENRAYPAAAPLFDDAARAAMGREMARRRGAA